MMGEGYDDVHYMGRFAAWRKARQLRRIGTEPIAVNIRLGYDSAAGSPHQVASRRVDRTFRGLTINGLWVVGSRTVFSMFIGWHHELLVTVIVSS